MSNIIIDSRLRSKIESINEFKDDVYAVKFKDLIDTFWFNSKEELQNFLREQEVERFYYVSLRKGYFTYKNEYNEIFKYIVSCNKGNLKLEKEEYVCTEQ